MLVICLHIVFAALLIYLSKWVGEKSVSYGYLPMGVFDLGEKSPAFNFFFRFGSPLVYILLLSSIFYSLGIDWIVKDIYFISIYYFVLRSLLLMVLGKTFLINWLYEIFVAFTSIGITYLLYTKVIITKTHLIPDYSNISNELWIIVIVFLYAVLNNIEVSSEGSEKRKRKYIKYYLKKFRGKYSNLVDFEVGKAGIPNTVNTQVLKAAVYSVMIYESFNRPTILRGFEYLLFAFGKIKTLGLMQVRTEKAITNEQSIQIAITKLLDFYKTARIESERKIPEGSKYLERNVIDDVIYAYNPSEDYVFQINEIMEIVDLELTSKTNKQSLR